MSKENDSSSKQREINECLSRASILLLCSHIESFFEDLILDILTFHEYNQTSISMLPDRLKVIQTLRKPITDNLGFDKKWKIIESMIQSPFANTNNKCYQGIFNLELHLKGFASPGSKNVDDLFKSIGINDVWNLVENKDTTMRSKNNLDAFINRRNNITHGSAADKPTMGNVRNYVRDVCAIALIFNAVVTEYIVNNFNVQNPWVITSI
ncbi:MAE_28990/MAE_18760 family HEPN-like nuclease [Synechocystis sp. PCC 7509]|uniref:MAE_28990/MAE_18760 family HEPN-like nuclease n=1 Tax=Synechocystis sp. PCC 7509 TaxID=927677 RepID=UPI0002AC4355|nr:MAE_28990/MAE_18760 family HEPN-like nuclease [Synechocystis sp. PCC 7509]